MTTSKKCPVCGSDVPASLGTRPKLYCSKACNEKAYRLRHINDEKFIQRKRKNDAASYLKHKAERLQKVRDYTAKNHSLILEKKRLYYCMNKQEHNQKTKLYYLANKERALQLSKEWALNNPEKVKAAKRKYEENNQIKVKQCRKKWALNNPEKIREYARKPINELHDHYIANKLKLSVTKTPTLLIEIKREQILTYRSVKQLIQTIKENQND
jgi:endogenous inhibitor of DNA gyrase (YacG/DUF329 family)